MVADQTSVRPEFTGTKKFQTIGGKLFDLFRARGMFMSQDAPIRIPLQALQDFLEQQDGTKAADVGTTINENPAVFSTEPAEDETWVITTRAGVAPVVATAGISHTFGARFLTPEPKPARPAPVRREPVKVDPNWATYSVPDFGDEDDYEADEDVDEPAALVDGDTVTDVISVPVDHQPAPAAPVEPAAVPAAIEPELAETTEPAATEPVTTGEALAVEPVPMAPEAADIPTTPAATEVADVPITPATSEVPDVLTTPAAPMHAGRDLSSIPDDALGSAISEQLKDDARSAHFAGQWIAEDRVPRLSRGDMRRMKEYIEEQDQPLTDAMLVTDILNVRPNAAGFELLKFAVSYRLSREHRDFDFVGTSDQRFWSTNSLPQIGTTRRKPNEIGTDYRFLVEEVPADVESRSITSVDHVLTFYEYTLGLLPYDEAMQRLLPRPVDDDQRSAVLTFEIPQSYTTYLVELRYPTPNRGGFLLGLDDFFAETLVPGAMVSVSSTGNDGHYKVECLAGKDQSDRLLELDDRRSPRYLFRPTTYSCEVAPEWLVSEDRFPKLGTEKPLDDKVRRRPDAVMEATFSRIGIEDGDSLTSTFDDLLAAVNVERPFSEALLRSVIEGSATVTDNRDGTLVHVVRS